MKINKCKCGFMKDINQKTCCNMCSIGRGHSQTCKKITPKSIVTEYWMNIIKNNSLNNNLINNNLINNNLC